MERPADAAMRVRQAIFCRSAAPAVNLAHGGLFPGGIERWGAQRRGGPAMETGGA